MNKPSKIALAGIALGVLALAGRYSLWETSPVPDVSNFRFDLKRIRELATQHDGALPTALNCLRVAQASFPIGMVIAGEQGYRRDLFFHSFQLVYPEHTIVIEAVHDKKTQELFFRGQPWSQEKWDEMQAAMRKASLILATHEHFDHVGGIATSPYLDEILDRVLLTRRQIEGFTMRFSGFPDGTLERLKALDYETYHSPAPGVVLIQAPGHSSGHQFVYLRLESGHEFLYVGDSVWEEGNITHLSGRPRLISLLIMEDHSQSANQIRLLSNGLADESFPHILISHDGDQISQYQEQGLLGKGFL